MRALQKQRARSQRPGRERQSKERPELQGSPYARESDAPNAPALRPHRPPSAARQGLPSVQSWRRQLLSSGPGSCAHSCGARTCVALTATRGPRRASAEVLAFSLHSSAYHAPWEKPLWGQGSQGGLQAARQRQGCVFSKHLGLRPKASEEQTVPRGWFYDGGEAPKTSKWTPRAELPGEGPSLGLGPAPRGSPRAPGSRSAGQVATATACTRALQSWRPQLKVEDAGQRGLMARADGWDSTLDPPPWTQAGLPILGSAAGTDLQACPYPDTLDPTRGPFISIHTPRTWPCRPGQSAGFSSTDGSPSHSEASYPEDAGRCPEPAIRSLPCGNVSFWRFLMVFG